jgi:hypothetical protein
MHLMSMLNKNSGDTFTLRYCHGIKSFKHRFKYLNHMYEVHIEDEPMLNILLWDSVTRNVLELGHMLVVPA